MFSLHILHIIFMASNRVAFHPSTTYSQRLFRKTKEAKMTAMHMMKPKNMKVASAVAEARE